jgi:flagellar FliL protein
VAAKPKPAPPAAAEASVTPLKKKKKRWPFLVLVLVVVLGACGGGAWWFFGRAPDTAHPKVAAVKPPVFYNLDPFTVNLVEENGDHYLQVSIVFQVSDDKAVEQIKTYLPVIRNHILLLLSAKKPSEISSPEGKQKLVAELVAAARDSVPGMTPEHGISGAFLGAFVIQ